MGGTPDALGPGTYTRVERARLATSAGCHKPAAHILSRPAFEPAHIQAPSTDRSLGPGSHAIKDHPPVTTPAGAHEPSRSFSGIPFRPTQMEDDERAAFVARGKRTAAQHVHAVTPDGQQRAKELTAQRFRERDERHRAAAVRRGVALASVEARAEHTMQSRQADDMRRATRRQTHEQLGTWLVAVHLASAATHLGRALVRAREERRDANARNGARAMCMHAYGHARIYLRRRAWLPHRVHTRVCDYALVCAMDG
jgi:hypothetical protein